MQTFFPGVYFKEVEFGGASRPIQGVDMSIGACVIYSEKGPIGEPVRCTGLPQFQEIFGGPISDAYGYYAVEGFFKNGGKTIWVVRTSHYSNISDNSTLTAKPAELVIKDNAVSPKDTIRLTVNSVGAWGNKIGCRVLKDSLVNSKLTAVANAGDKHIILETTRGAYEGCIVSVGDEVVTVTNVDHNSRTLYFEEALIGSQAIGVTAISNEFSLIIYKGIEVVETFTGLSINEGTSVYFESRVNDPYTGSSYIIAENLFSETVGPDNKPKPNNSVEYFFNGTDGLDDITVLDLIGNQASRTGMYALDYVQDTFNLFIPESQDEDVNRALFQYCEARMDAFGIGSIPEGKTPIQAEHYRLVSGNFNTSYGALYYSWGEVLDPIGIGNKPKKLIPLDGHLAGMYARNDRQFGIHQSPAGEHAVLVGVDRLEHDTNDTDNGFLNSSSINCIRSLQGAGIVAWGTRTLSADTRWRYIHARRIFIYVEKSIMLGTRWAVFKPNVPATWKSIVRSVTAFLSTIEGLDGNSKEERFAVVCDESTNPTAIKEQGKIVTKIGLNIASVGEFIIFEIGQMREGATLTE